MASARQVLLTFSCTYKSCVNVLYVFLAYRAMRPKERGPAQHGGPPDWLEKSYPTGLILYVMDGPVRTVPVALTEAAQL